MTLNKGNSKSRQSKEEMRQALLILLETKDFHRITIQEITDQAGLSRRTYYRNYQSKIDIVSEILMFIWQDYLIAIKEKKPNSLSEITQTLYDVSTQYKYEIMLLHKHNLLLHLIPIAIDDLPDIIAYRHPNVSIDNTAIQYMVTFIVSGYFHVIPTWLEKNPEISAQQMGEYLERMFLMYLPDYFDDVKE